MNGAKIHAGRPGLRVSVLTTLVCAALSTGACGERNTYSAMEIASFQSSGVKRIIAENDAGDIRIELGRGHEIVVEQRLWASGYGLEESAALRAFEKSPLEGRHSADGTLILSMPHKLPADLGRSDWLIRAPQAVTAECFSKHGDVTAKLMGKSRLEAPDGEVFGEHLSGDVSALAGGRVTLLGITGNVRVQSGDDARIEDVRGAVDVSVRDGEAMVQVGPPFGATVRVIAAHDIELRIPSVFAAAYTAQTSGGTIEIRALSMRRVSEDPTRITGIVGGGQGTVYVESYEADVEIIGQGD